MLRLSVQKEEYLMIGENIKITFLGGTKSHLRIMIDAPKEVNVVRGKAIENREANATVYLENDCCD